MRKQSKAGAVSPGNQLNVTSEPNEPPAALIARTALRPTVNAAVTASLFLRSLHQDLDLSELVTELSNQCATATAGNLARAEGMLMAQAHTLDAIFGSLARRAALNMGEHLDAADRYMRLALKAQSQCRAALETLATIKNPPVVFARQANISHGPQQVNNDSATSTHAGARAREIQSEPIKQLEQTYEQRLDTGTAGAAIGSDPALASVGEIDRAKVGRG